MPLLIRTTLIQALAIGLFVPVGATAHSKSAAKSPPAPAVQQVVKPPIAQAWVDLATHHSDLPGFAGALMGGGGAGLGSLFGGGGDKGRGNVFGGTQGLGMTGSGQWLDVAVHTRANPSLSQAQQAIPPGLQLGATLNLVAPVPDKPIPVPERDDEPREPHYERPKGKLLLYWGCSESVREGQPRVLDFANLRLEDIQRIMVARGHTPKGARSQPGYPAWPNKTDDRKVPAGARIAGENGFSGQGVPEGFRFDLRPDVDFMPPLDLQRHALPSGATQLNWPGLEQSRAYFISAMGAKPGTDGSDSAEMVLWSSSELPDTGFALHDYQTPAGIERWVKEKVLLPPSTLQCAIPAGIFGTAGESGAGMLRMMAYGPEQAVAHPPRPTDPKVPWTPDWSVRVRTKSSWMGLLGMENTGSERGAGRPKPAAEPEEKKKPNVGDLLKGIFGR
ncbi:hypothetical protein [Inhella gelatinilytica]|uniref:Uncharacterized protein n=1 Tax=Inhella gelatinilytica TaxID=2795030 RepID=A0A931IWV3_9BURK|nr:hypothetical protein [Inhella gelatinilytica]MBH9553629.1 hypothetical protein [Inhella gelatinilytica]